jgi:bacterioferritin (cytochrome b1)
MSELERLRQQAARCLRLAREATDEVTRSRLTDLAAEYEEHARRLERNQRSAPSRTGSDDHVVQQQQQPQQPQEPKKED